MAKGSLRVNGIIVDADGELKASTGDSIVIREDDGSAVITVDTSGNVLIGGPTTVGADDSGHDVKFFGETTGKSWLWDQSADKMVVNGITELIGSLTVGVDDSGQDVKFFGETSGKYMLWDQSADSLLINGDTLIGGITTAETIVAGTPRVQVEGVGYADSSISVFSNSNDTSGSYLFIGKSRGTALSSDTIVQDGDFVGGIEWVAADGTDRASRIAGIYGVVDGTPDEDDTPGELTFYTTADGANSGSQKMVIKADGKVGIGISAPETLLHLESTQTANLKLHNTDVGYSPGIIFQGKTNAADNLLGRLVAYWDDDSSEVARIAFESGTDTTNKDDGIISFWTSAAGDTVAERMRVMNDGKVGIGTTDPLEKLQVKGTVGFETTDSTNRWVVYAHTDDTFRFNYNGSGNDELTIATNGQVTFTASPTGFNYVATVASSGTGISVTGSGTAAAGVTVAHADTSNQASVDNSGRTYIQDITLDTFGHITAITSATETVTDTTYSVANSSTLGLIKIGYTQTGKNYPVQLSSEQAYVNVPWTDTDTTYSVATTSANGLMSSSDKSKSDNMGLVYLDSITFAGNTQYSFDVNSHTSYTNYYITMHNVRVGSAGGTVLIRSGGSTNNQNQSKGNVKTWYGSLAGPVTFDDNVGNTTGMSMLKYTSNNSDEGLSGSFTLFAPRSSSICTMINGVWSGNYNGSLVTHVGGGIRTASYNDRYLTFMGYTSSYSSSNMAGGYARLYGIK